MAPIFSAVYYHTTECAPLFPCTTPLANAHVGALAVAASDTVDGTAGALLLQKERFLVGDVLLLYSVLTSRLQ